MTAREFARQIKKPYTTVAGWLQKGQVPGAEAQMVGTFKVWLIPVSALKTYKEPKRGRPKKQAKASDVPKNRKPRK